MDRNAIYSGLYGSQGQVQSLLLLQDRPLYSSPINILSQIFCSWGQPGGHSILLLKTYKAQSFLVVLPQTHNSFASIRRAPFCTKHLLSPGGKQRPNSCLSESIGPLLHVGPSPNKELGHYSNDAEKYIDRF